MLNKLGVRGIRLSLFALSIMVAIFFAFHISAEAGQVIGFWEFEEQDGAVVGDTSGSGNHGEIIDNCEWVEEGMFGGALKAGGEDAWVFVEHEPITEALIASGTHMTMAGWMNVQTYEGEVVYIISEGGNYFLRNQLHVIQDPGVNVEGWKGCWADPNYGTEMGVWYHLAATFDGETLIPYVNGEKAHPTGNILDSPGTCAVGDVFTLGTCGWHPGYGGGILIMDQVLMADYAMTEAEINYLYNNGVYEGYEGAAVEPAGKLSSTWSSIKSQY